MERDGHEGKGEEEEELMVQQQRMREEEEFRRAVHQPEAQRMQGQKDARIACHPYEKALHDCYATKWFPMVTCQDESDAFWNCYKEKRGFLKSKLDLWREQQAEKVAGTSIPPTRQPPPPSSNQ